ncbi:MAG TPA: NAD(P)H-binding protein [Albitalea sp.]
MDIAVMGATGHTGAKIAATLLATGHRVRALARSAGKLAALERAGAQPFAGDISDAAFLADAFGGADAAYTLLPTDRRASDYAAQQAREGEAAAQALARSGVRRVVFLSSLGAERAEGTGLIAGLHAQEERLKQLAGIDLMLLRPVSFFENFHDALPVIRQLGVHADAVAAQLAVPMIATRDIADAASRALVSQDWHGVQVRELLGPRELSHDEAARILGPHIGLPELAYVQLPGEEMAQALVGGGVSESFARLYVEMVQAINAGRVQPREGRHAGNTTPTRFEDFVGELAAAWRDLPANA